VKLRFRQVTNVAVLFVIGIHGSFAAAQETDFERTDRGLVVLYDFKETDRSVIRDRSETDDPVHLKVENPQSIRQRGGSLVIRGNTRIRSKRPPARLINAVRRSGEITVEVWIRPADTEQRGPARILTISRNSGARNFTLGQDGTKFDVRFRTTKTNRNGLPSLASTNHTASDALTHIVYTRNRMGEAKIYIDGKEDSQRDVPGSASNWDDSFMLALGNEQDGGRPWKGMCYLIAIFDRQLSSDEVTQNYKAGVDAQSSQRAAVATVDPRATHFETKVAPLLSAHCLECHDSASKEGGFDLSKKLAAFEGGENGKALIPGRLDESPLWTLVESDEMPADRPSLSVKEKEILRNWIEDGAVWSIEKIDPAIYAHAGRTNENHLRRLTVSEYIETVKHILGVDIAQEARETLPADLRADGFSNTAYNLNVDLKHVNGYASLADIAVSRMDVQAFANRFSRKIKFTDDEMGAVISKMGRWILRGPVEEREIITYRGISTTVASSGGSYEEAVGHIIEAMLQSPRFIYRIENQRGDGASFPVSEYELASRLSYIIWGGPPDKRLMEAADEGDLFDRAGVEEQVDRMLSDPRAIRHSMQFVSEWLNLDRLENMKPNPDRFPNWNRELAIDMQKETLAFFDEVVWKQKRPLADLLNAQVTFATQRLAKHYGLPASGEATSEDQLSKYDLTSVTSRGGILTHGSVLTVGGDEASMVTRGLLVMHELLRGVVKDPPPCVDTTPVPTKAGLTQRSIALQRLNNTNCGGCHGKFEPLAFGLEKFDGLGSFHHHDEHGNELRDDGEVLFPGDAKPVAFKSSGELMDLLAESDRVREAITWKLTQFALGRPPVAEDAFVVESIHRTSQKEGGTYASLIKAIVMSDLVQAIKTETDEPN
jgi:hypothetical protein